MVWSKEFKSKYMKEYREKHKEAKRIYMKAYFQRPDITLKYRQQYHKNKENILKRHRINYNKKPELYRATKRREIEKIKDAVYAYYGNKCNECGCPNFKFINRNNQAQCILEINHLNGADNKNRLNTVMLCYNLLNGKIKWGNYNLLCKMCNQLHYLRDLCNVRGYKLTFNDNERNNK